MLSLFEHREVDEELRAVDDALQVEVVLSAEQRQGVLVRSQERHAVNLVPERHPVRRA